MKTPPLLAVLVLFLSCALVRAADQPEVVLLWPNGAPGSEGKTADEKVVTNAQGERTLFGINQPSLTIVLPAKDKATGAGVIVMPGGGHYQLSYDSEGTYVAQWLADHGIAAFVLKYRLSKLPPTAPAGSVAPGYTVEKDELADIQRAMRLVRSKAGDWEIDPARLGVIGFSAGGELAAMVSIKNDNGHADAADPIDRFGCRPAFQGLIYPGNPTTIAPTKDSPPAFLLGGEKDKPEMTEGLANAYIAFEKAGVPTDLHIYTGIGHGFGLRPSAKGAIADWPQRFYDWLKDRKFLNRQS